MSKQTEALKMAQAALAASDDFLFNYHDCEPNNEREVDAYSEIRANNMAAWEAVREALAEQPAQQQEPVAHVYLFDPNGRPRVAWDNAKDIKIGDKLYTSPPASKPLTDEEIAKIASTPCAVVGSYVHTFARAIEAAHGITGEQK